MQKSKNSSQVFVKKVNGSGVFRYLSNNYNSNSMYSEKVITLILANFADYLKICIYFD